jgi:hypothetical protein
MEAAQSAKQCDQVPVPLHFPQPKSRCLPAEAFGRLVQDCAMCAGKCMSRFAFLLKLSGIASQVYDPHNLTTINDHEQIRIKLYS